MHQKVLQSELFKNIKAGAFWGHVVYCIIFMVKISDVEYGRHVKTPSEGQEISPSPSAAILRIHLCQER